MLKECGQLLTLANAYKLEKFGPRDTFEEEILELKELVPQETPKGYILWLPVSSGADRLASGDTSYDPSDIDTIAFDEKTAERLKQGLDQTRRPKRQVDVYPIDTWFVENTVDPRILQETAEDVEVYPGGPRIKILNRMFIAAQKASEYEHTNEETGEILALPRDKDKLLVRRTLKSLRTRPQPPQQLIVAKNAAMDALPPGIRAITRATLNDMSREIATRRRAA